MRFLAFLLISLAFFSETAAAKSAGYTVLELYTSQGCPSCPQADRIFMDLAESAESTNIIALGCHVTYFDRRGWRDSMSRDFCDARQAAYRKSETTQKIYTPQMVINGKAEAVGNRPEMVRAALTSAAKVQPVGIGSDGRFVDIYLSDMDLKGEADVWLFGYDDFQLVQIQGGANAGKTVSYARPVSGVVHLLSWDGRSGRLSFPVGDMQAKNYAVIIQQAGGIIGAGTTRSLSKN